MYGSAALMNMVNIQSTWFQDTLLFIWALAWLGMVLH